VAAVLAALLLAVHPLFWEWSLALEVFPLNACLATAEIYWLIRLDAEPDRAHWFVLAVATGALATANHHTIVFVIPAALMIAWRHRANVIARPGVMAVAAAAALAGLSLYLYIPWAAARQPFINWGDVSSASDLWHHFLRTTYGTLRLTSAAAASASGTGMDRLATLFSSCSPAEAILVPIGALVAWRRARTFFWISILTAGLAGPIFAIVSNLDTNIAGYAWVLRRFFLLPHAVAAPLQAVAIAAIAAWLARQSPRRRAGTIDIAVATAGLTVIALMAVTEHGAIDQRDNHLARTYAEDILATMPPQAVLLAGGDDVVLPVAYLQAVEHQRPDVTLVMLGPLTRGDWFIRELRTRDPQLVIPFDHYDPSTGGGTIRALVEANPSRPFMLAGPPQDASLEGGYWYLPHGLAFAIEPQARDVSLAEMAAENERLFAGYHVPPADLAGHQNFDPYVLRAYSTGARQVGQQYQAAQEPTGAIAWFRRALAIDPADGVARALLTQAGGT
jgi:hypothetical protein